MNSKGFRMRRDHEAKQELGITTEEDRVERVPERPMSDQQPARRSKKRQPSLIGRIWKAIRR